MTAVTDDLHYIACINEHEPLDNRDDRAVMGKMLVNLAKDVIKDQNSKDFKLDNARMDYSESAGFEIGYMIQNIQEHYRRMLDKWYSARRDVTMYYNIEVTLYLEEIEHLYWSIKHEVYMLHEIERKYKLKEDMTAAYVDPKFAPTETYPTRPPLWGKKKFIKNIKPSKLLADVKGGDKDDKPFKNNVLGTTPRSEKTRWPHEYGWDVYDWK